MGNLFFPIILLALVIFISGCVGQLEKTARETAAETYEENKTETEDSDILDNTSLEEANQTQKEQENTTTSAQKLLFWQKESGIRVPGVSSSIIFLNNQYWMYYTGRGIELARSSDGLNFVVVGTMIDVKDVSGVDMVTNPAVFKTIDGKYRMLFEGSKMFYDKNDRKLYSAVSSDGLVWIVEEGVRFQDAGDGKPGELFASVPDVIRLNDGKLRMYYTRGATSATALSGNEGLNWTKETNLKLRKVAIDLDIVLLDDGTYKLFFTTFEDEFGVGEQWITSASSADGINFSADEGKLIEPSTPGGLITDPDVIKTSNGYRIYYGEFEKGEHELHEKEPNIMSAFSSG
ncbi:MAG: hypothetical protein HZB67_02980 [Candidatus Aenigmarchaeota archaeon]|nr:hypothetical protein [Candidatus Aenigmarchaeota archaeon]